MPWKTKYGSHYHMTQGCHGADIPCDTNGLTPCSDCCGGTSGDGNGGMAGGTPLGAGSGASGSEPYFMSLEDDVDIAIAACDEGDIVTLEDGNVLVFREASDSGLPEDGYIIENERGIPLRIATEDDLCDIGEQVREGVATLGSGETWEDYKARVRAKSEDTPEADRARMASHREDGLRAADAVTSGGMASKIAPMVSQDAIQARIGELEHELALLRAQAELAKAFPEADPANPYALAEKSLQEDIDQFIARFWAGHDSPELRAEHVVDSVSQISYEVCNDLQRRSRNGQIDMDIAVERIADRLEVEGYGDKLDAEVEKRLGWDGDTEAIKAIGVVRARRKQRQDDQDWDVAERISSIQSEAMREMGLRSVPLDRREELMDRIARKIHAEGLDDKLNDGVSGALTSMNAHTAGLAVARVRDGKGKGDGDGSTGPKPKTTRRGGTRGTPAKAQGDAPAGKAPAKRATKRRARKPADPMEGMTPKQEQDAFDAEFSTKTTEAYMGATGYEGSKSGRHLYGKELSGAVRTDLKKWLGHLGVPKGAVRVASHTYSGGQSLKVEAKLDRATYGASESEFKAAYRRHFWKMVPDWGTVETSTGRVDVSKLMGPGDNGPLMEDVIDTAWRQYQRGETDVDCGRGGVFGNPRHEIYLNEQGRKVAQRMQRIVDSYNYDESNGMVDYFNTGFYAYPKVKLS